MGCSKSGITEKKFDIIWKEYLRQNFVESFDEKQSLSQKEKIFKSIITEHDIVFEDIKIYMMEKEPEKYKKLFLK